MIDFEDKWISVECSGPARLSFQAPIIELHRTLTSPFPHLTLSNILLWSARFVGGAVVAAILFTLIPELLRADPEKSEGLQTGRQRFEFVCFPIIALLGLFIAYWQPGIGGGVSLAGMLMFFTLRPNLSGDPFMLAMLMPGSLYVTYALVQCMLTP